MKTRSGLVVSALYALWPAMASAQPAAAPTEPPKLELREAPKPTIAAEDPLTWHPGGLTPDVVAQRTVSASPTIAARQADIDAANAKVDQALIGYLPRVTLKASYMRTTAVNAALSQGGGALLGTSGKVSGPAATQLCGQYACANTPDGQFLPLIPIAVTIPIVPDNYMLSATLSVPLSDYVLRLSSTLAGTRANERSTRLNKQAETLKVATDSRIAYYNWVRGVAATTVAESALVRVKALKKDTEAQFSVGTATKADVLRLDSQVAATELTISDARNLKDQTADLLAFMMAETLRDYEVGENVRAFVPRADQQTPLPALVTEALRKRLEIKALAESDRALANAASAVRMGELPRLDGFGEFDYGRPNRVYLFDPKHWHSNWVLGLTLSYAVNDTFASKASAAELDANRRSVQAGLESFRRAIQAEVTSAYLDERKARVALDASQRGLKSAQEAYRVAVDLYRVGRATTTELIAAEQELLSASLREVNAVIDMHLASIRLTHATGRDVPRS